MKVPKQEWFGTNMDSSTTASKQDNAEQSPAEKKTLPRLPNSLLRRLHTAINTVKRHIARHGLDQYWGDLLDSYRAFSPLQGTDEDGIPIRGPLYPHFLRSEVKDPIARAILITELGALDAAVAEAEHYRPEKEMTEGTISAVTHFIRTGSTDPDTPVAEKLLLEMGILTARRGGDSVVGTQGWIKKQVRLKTSLSPRTIDGLAAKLRKKAKLQKGIATS